MRRSRRIISILKSAKDRNRHILARNVASVGAVVLASLAVLGSCAIDYVSGQPTLVMISEEEEVALGRQQDPLVVAEFGLYDDPDLAAYVDDLGKSIAKVSHRPGIAYHYRVLDDGMVNAFALPGGYIYFPRGILAFFNSEDELVGVLAHETAHVVARHGVEQQSQRILVTGFGLTDRLAATFPIMGGLISAPINLGMLKYSRDQESEADRLGVEYSTRMGYDASALADFFQTLGAMSEQSGQTIPTYMSTHPHPDDRYEDVNRMAVEWQEQLGVTPEPSDRAAYLQKIDGIVYGKDPRRGFTSDGRFYHPELGFQFPIPPGWTLLNKASQVIVFAEDEQSLVQMTLAAEATVEQAADAFLASQQLEVLARSQQPVNGWPTVSLQSIHTDGRRRTVVRSQFIAGDGGVLVFHGLAAENDYKSREAAFDYLYRGVAPIADPAILHVEPRRLHVTRAPETGEFQSVLRTLGVADDELQEMANLNGLRLVDHIDEGDWLKIVR